MVALGGQAQGLPLRRGRVLRGRRGDPRGRPGVLWIEAAVNHTEVARYWNENAEAWTRLARAE